MADWTKLEQGGEKPQDMGPEDLGNKEAWSILFGEAMKKAKDEKKNEPNNKSNNEPNNETNNETNNKSIAEKGQELTELTQNMDSHNEIKWKVDENGMIALTVKVQGGIPNPNGVFTQHEYINNGGVNKPIVFPSIDAFKKLAKEGELTDDNNTFTSTAVEYINSLFDAQQHFLNINMNPQKNEYPNSATAVDDVAAQKLLQSFLDEISWAQEYLSKINDNHFTVLRDQLRQKQNQNQEDSQVSFPEEYSVKAR